MYADPFTEIREALERLQAFGDANDRRSWPTQQAASNALVALARLEREAAERETALTRQAETLRRLRHEFEARGKLGASPEDVAMWLGMCGPEAAAAEPLCDEECREEGKCSGYCAGDGDAAPPPEEIGWADVRAGDTITLLMLDRQEGLVRESRTVVSVDWPMIALAEGGRVYAINAEEPDRNRSIRRVPAADTGDDKPGA